MLHGQQLVFHINCAQARDLLSAIERKLHPFHWSWHKWSRSIIIRDWRRPTILFKISLIEIDDMSTILKVEISKYCLEFYVFFLAMFFIYWFKSVVLKLRGIEFKNPFTFYEKLVINEAFSHINGQYRPFWEIRI